MNIFIFCQQVTDKKEKQPQQQQQQQKSYVQQKVTRQMIQKTVLLPTSKNSHLIYENLTSGGLGSSPSDPLWPATPLSAPYKAPSTPATMSKQQATLSKQRSTLSKQHSTLLPQTATMSNDSIVKFRLFVKVEIN